MGFTQKELIEIRHYLHANPELSGEEKETAFFIRKQLQKLKPTQIIDNIGGYGIVATFDSGSPGKKVLFRTDMDALPILEEMDLEYKSKNEGISHKCGHDGHLTILLGLANRIKESGLKKGKAYLLFQPAEETGQGACAMLQNTKMKVINPDFVFAYHNVPGLKKGSVIIKEGSICAASVGIRITLKGKSSHAAEPENGTSPIPVIMKMLNLAEKLNKTDFKDLGLATPVYIKLGEETYGTSPGDAILTFTLRAAVQKDFEMLKKTFQDELEKFAKANQIEYKIEWVEEFPATVNNKIAADIAEAAAKKCNLNIEKPANGFRWSEDFGHFTHQYKGALIGLGSGKNQPALHHPTYDFPDDILQDGINLYYQILLQTTNVS